MSTSTNGHSAFLPLLLIAATSVGLAGFQGYALSNERAALAQLNDVLATQVDEAHRVRMQLDSLARNTANLARDGNPNAAALVKVLEQNGITIDSASPPPQRPGKSRS